MYDILSLRILCNDFTNDMPHSYEDLANYVNSIIDHVERGIVNINSKVLPTEKPNTVYEGYVDEDNIYDIFREYYAINNEKYNYDLVINVIHMYDLKVSDLIIDRLGLKNFKGNMADLLTIFVAQIGLDWNRNKALEVCILPAERLTRLTRMSYLNSVLAYVTGYCISDNREVSLNKSINEILTIYTGFFVLPFMRKNPGKRPIDNIGHVITKLNLEGAKKYIEDFNYAFYLNTLFSDRSLITDMMNSIGMINNTVHYFIHSIYDYKNVTLFTLRSRPVESGKWYNILSKYSDRALIEAVEENVPYNTRGDLMKLVLDEFRTYKWSLSRRKFCNNSADIILSYGRAMHYHCYNLNTFLLDRVDSDLREDRGVKIENATIDNPHRYLRPDDIEMLIALLQETAYREDIIELLVSNLKYVKNITASKQNILVVCYDEGKRRLNKYTIKLFEEKYNSDNLDDFNIDYISVDLMRINDKYHTIDPFSFPDDVSLTILEEDDLYKYSYIVYEYCPLSEESKLLEDKVLEVLSEKLTYDGNFISILKDNNTYNKKKIEKHFEYVDKYRTHGDIYYYIYKNRTLDLFEYFLGPNWRDEWYTKDNPGGGDCMYYAVAQALGQRHTVEQLRNILVDNIPDEMFQEMKMDLATEKKDIIRWKMGDGEKYINLDHKKEVMYNEYMRTLTKEDVKKGYMDCSKWGTSRELRILANVLKFTPIVLSGDTRNKIVYPNEFSQNLLCTATDSKKIVKMGISDNVIILLESNRHYKSILNRKIESPFRKDELPDILVRKFMKSCLSVIRSGINVR